MMRTWKRKGLAALAVAGLVAQATTAARCEDASPATGAQTVPAPAQPAPAPTPVPYGTAGAGLPAGPYGYCPPGYYAPGHYGVPCPSCGCLGCVGCVGAHGLSAVSALANAAPPRTGWSPPTRVPIYRLPVHYQKFWPNFWYGQPGVYAPVFPMVYQPTDTTQMGFYYQRVPYWQPNPAMVPQFRPWPEDWHVYKYPRHHSGYYPGRGGHYAGSIGYGGAIAPVMHTAPAVNGSWSQPAPESQPEPSAEVEASLAPAPRF